MPTEALGSAKEAHHRWPEGRSEQRASKAKDGPPNGLQRFAVIVEVAGQCLSQLRRPCSPLSCGSADLKFGREGFEVGADDGSTVEVREFFGVGDRLDFLTQALWDTIESD